MTTSIRTTLRAALRGSRSTVRRGRAWPTLTTALQNGRLALSANDQAAMRAATNAIRSAWRARGFDGWPTSGPMHP